MQQSLPCSPPLPARKPPGPDQRQAACTHTTVTRLYDDYGSYRCQICRRHPNIGWVYCCTQDHGGFLPESAFTATTETAPLIIKEDNSVWRLKQWMYEAVLKGLYTVEQFSTLFQQRQGVKKAIFSQSNKTVTLSTSGSSGEITTSANTTVATLASIASSYSDEVSNLRPHEKEISYVVKQSQNIPDGQSLDESDIDNITRTENASNPSYPVCGWTCCQSCRPTYRDRAWLSLDAVVNEPITAPPSWEFENRRISDARIVANIGLPKLKLPSQVDDLRYHSSSEVPWLNDSNHVESETDGLAYGKRDGIRTKGGFRAAIRRSLRGAVGHTRDMSGESETSSKYSTQSSLRRLGQSMLFRPRRSSQSTTAYNTRIIDNDQLQESLVLMIAANTALPDAKASVQDLYNGEVEVEDGVAVTEEGIGMSAADIIITQA